MKIKLTTTALLLMLGFGAMAQIRTFDERLLTQFTTEQLAKMESTSPATLAYWEYYIDHGFVIVPLSEDKEYTFDGSFENVEEFNPLSKGILPVNGRAQYFSDKEQNVLLLVYSKELLLTKFEASMADKD